MPDLNKSHVREGEYDDGAVKHNLSGAPAAPRKATGLGALVGAVLGAIVGGGGQATLAGAAAGASLDNSGIGMGIVVGAVVGAVLGAAAGYGVDAADRRGELQSTGTGTQDANPALRDRDTSAGRRSNLDAQMTASEYVDDTSPPNDFPQPQGRYSWQANARDAAVSNAPRPDAAPPRR